MTNTNGKRNRIKGADYEREVASSFRDAGFSSVITTRAGDRSRDAQKIDLMNADEQKVGRLPYNVQCKNCTFIPYAQVLSEIPHNEGIVNVVLHKQTKRQGDKQFKTTGKYAFLSQKDFMAMVKTIETLKQELLKLKK